MGDSLPSLMPRTRPWEGAGRIDRVAWAAGTCVEAHGVRLGVRTNAPAILERLARCLPPGSRPSRSAVVDELFSVWVDPADKATRPSRVYVGARRRARTRDLHQAFAVLESELRLSLAARSKSRTFVHAGVVGWRGWAILVPGRSRSGKTTLVAELVRAGATYLSDEFAVLDARGRVHPFAKPLSIRGAGGCDLHAQRPSAEDLGGRSGTEPLPVGLVVLATHRPGAHWEPERLTPGQAVIELLAHTVPARLRPAASLGALERAVARAVVVKGERGEATELATRLLRQLEGSTATAARGGSLAGSDHRRTR
ncbi:MAG TPA: hypothetical protein VJ648_02260 [Vicinamibacteria bacterium]|nr:hypothetical protein [Vicinamibacteria bacterium]